MAATRKYLVTGGAGFIGTALVKRLISDGHQVTVLDNFSRGKRERLEGLNCEVIHGDVTHAHTVINAAHGCDSVIHLAYVQGTQTFYAEPRQVLNTAMRGMLNVLSACEANGIGELLLMSSSEAYQVAPVTPTPEDIPLVVPDVLNPRYSYGGGKIACELMTLAWERAGVLDRATICRPHNIIGPDMGREHVLPEFCIRMNKLVSEHSQGIISFPIQGTGQETRSFCHVDDCVDQLALILASPGPHRVYHLGMEDERSIAETAQLVAAVYGREIKVIPGALPKGSPPRRRPDTTRVRALGFVPGWTVEGAIADTVRWYQAHG